MGGTDMRKCGVHLLRWQTGKAASSMIDHIEIRETTFSFHDDDGTELFTGTPDVVRVYQQPRVVAVEDFKYGRIEVQEAALNLQLRAYLVMVAEVHQADWYYGCLIQPRTTNRPHIVRYDRNDIALARLEIKEIWKACHAADAPRTPSISACVFCHGREERASAGGAMDR